MKNLFVPYELAAKLKEKGFDAEKYFATWNIEEQQIYPAYSHGVVKESKHLIIAPLWQQVIDWLREKKHIIVESDFSGMTSYCYRVKILGNYAHPLISTEDYQGYYSALESGIEKALELI